jgi:hypothetical protein
LKPYPEERNKEVAFKNKYIWRNKKGGKEIKKKEGKGWTGKRRNEETNLS